MGIELSADSGKVLIAFGCYLVGVAALGVFAHRYLARGSFVKEYFLGNRGLGPWVLALTIAATAISGGTFMGFPSLIYTNGWIMALWICSYMVVPLTAMALIGKRINQVARISGSVTVPDVLRDRFQSPILGITASLLILLFLAFNLVAQFKAGGLVMKEALRLPPEPAAFLGADVDESEFVPHLVARFRTEDGQDEFQTIPVPFKEAAGTRTWGIYRPERNRVDGVLREVRVSFDLAGAPEPVERVIKFPAQKVRLPGFTAPVDKGYLLGLLIFALTVVAYTTYGGFWAVTWTDVLEGLVMLAGVLIMVVLAVRAVPAIGGQTGLAAATEHLRQQDPTLVYGPGPKNYLPVGMGFSFFLMWSLMAPGQPSGMVRLMSFKDTPSLRRALLLVSVYYILTYLSLLVIFICARAIFPTEYLHEIGSKGEPDSIMPAMIRHLASPLVAGLLLAAPYAAIMSTVAAFLLMISSSLVRDLYQRVINPQASPATIKRLSYLVTALVGIGITLVAIHPPGYLQYIIVFTGSGQGCSFLVPMTLALYWRRATKQGVLAGMAGGFLVLFGFYVLGWIDSGTRAGDTALSAWCQANLGWLPGWGQERFDAFAPLYAGGVDPLVWGLAASLLLTLGVSLLTRSDEELARKYFP
jgi:Na+/proline symporter